MITAFKVQKCDNIFNFIIDTNKRLSGGNYVKNPFTKESGLKFIVDKDYIIIFAVMYPIYIFNFPKWLYGIIIKKALRKIGYKGYFRQMKQKEILNYMVGLQWGKAK